jgi:hypothetical protein
MSTDERLILTADEATALLPDGDDYVHCFSQPSAGMFIGTDHERAGVEDVFRKAKQIEIGGDNCKGMGHPLVVWTGDDRLRFFAADMEKVAAFEAARDLIAKAEGTAS